MNKREAVFMGGSAAVGDRGATTKNNEDIRMQSTPAAAKQAERDSIASDVERFLSRGGKITQLETMKSNDKSHNDRCADHRLSES